MNTFVGKGAGKYIVKRLFNAKRQASICSPYLSKYHNSPPSKDKDLVRKAVSEHYGQH
jgi:hypothetical protein